MKIIYKLYEIIMNFFLKYTQFLQQMHYLIYNLINNICYLIYNICYLIYNIIYYRNVIMRLKLVENLDILKFVIKD